MGSKRLDRRELLKSGAALAGGMTLGAVAPAMGQTQASEAGHGPASPPMIKGDEAKINRLRRSLQACDVGPHPPRRPAVA